MKGYITRTSVVVIAALSASKTRGDELDEPGRAQDAEEGDAAHEYRYQRHDLLASRHAACSPSATMVLENTVTKAVDRAPSAKQVAQQVGDAEGGEEHVHLATATEQESEQRLADQAEHAAAHDGDTDDTGCPGVDVLFRGGRAWVPARRSWTIMIRERVRGRGSLRHAMPRAWPE